MSAPRPSINKGQTNEKKKKSFGGSLVFFFLDVSVNGRRLTAMDDSKQGLLFRVGDSEFERQSLLQNYGNHFVPEDETNVRFTPSSFLL